MADSAAARCRPAVTWHRRWSSVVAGLSRRDSHPPGGPLKIKLAAVETRPVRRAAAPFRDGSICGAFCQGCVVCRRASGVGDVAVLQVSYRDVERRIPGSAADYEAFGDPLLLGRPVTRIGRRCAARWAGLSTGRCPENPGWPGRTRRPAMRRPRPQPDRRTELARPSRQTDRPARPPRGPQPPSPTRIARSRPELLDEIPRRRHHLTCEIALIFDDHAR